MELLLCITDFSEPDVSTTGVGIIKMNTHLWSSVSNITQSGHNMPRSAQELLGQAEH